MSSRSVLLLPFNKCVDGSHRREVGLLKSKEWTLELGKEFRNSVLLAHEQFLFRKVPKWCDLENDLVLEAIDMQVATERTMEETVTGERLNRYLQWGDRFRETGFLVFSYRSRTQLSNLIIIPRDSGNCFLPAPCNLSAVRTSFLRDQKVYAPYAAQGAIETFFKICLNLNFAC